MDELKSQDPSKPKRGNPKWLPGVSGNPAGRKPGTRARYGEDFIKDLHETWKVHGKSCLEALATGENRDKAVFAKVAALIVPKQLEVTQKGELTEEQEAELVAKIIMQLMPQPANDKVA